MTDTQATGTAPPTAPELDPIEEHRLKKGLQAAQTERRDLLEQLSELQARFDLLSRLHRQPFEPPPIVQREKRSAVHEGTVVLSLSDWHVEEQVDPAEIGGINAFNPDVASRRVDRLIDGILWLYDFHHGRKFAIREIVVGFLGDMITGWIHEELRSTNAMSPPAAVVLYEEFARKLLRALLENTDARLRLVCVAGNHGRITTRKSIKQVGTTSYEWLAYVHLAKWLKDNFADRVDVHVATGASVYLDIYDTTHRFIHGDQIGYQGGVGGVTIPLNKWLLRTDQTRRADCTYLGHFHSLESGKKFVKNGSLIGYSEYASWIGAEFEPPQQAFTVIDARYGRTAVWPVFCHEDARMGSDPRIGPGDVLDSQAAGESLAARNAPIAIDGVTRSRGEWAEIAERDHGVPADCFRRRIRAGWDPQQALTEAPRSTGFAAGHGTRHVPSVA